MANLGKKFILVTRLFRFLFRFGGGALSDDELSSWDGEGLRDDVDFDVESENGSSSRLVIVLPLLNRCDEVPGRLIFASSGCFSETEAPDLTGRGGMVKEA